MKKLLLISIFILLFIISGEVQGLAQKISSLEENFKTPPLSTRPYCWWHWMGNNITAEGITADLEAMKISGIAGATIFNLSSNADKGGFVKNSYTQGITYHNAAWWKLVKHAAVEADRLGLEIGLHNCVGYATSGGPWITPEKSMQEIVWTAFQAPMPFTEVLAQPATKLGYYRDIAVLAVPGGEPSPDKVIDITSFMKADGSLDWDVPAGSWTIYRFGHTSTGKRPRPVPEDLNARVLEADKLSFDAMSFHLHQVLDPLKENLGPLVGRSFKHILFDSYEAGDQNWTPKMREEFLKRRGYDIIPWLPVLAGRAIGGKERASRFEWDLKTTVYELFVENYFLLGKKMINEMGMQVQIEAYGGPFDEVYAVSAADMPLAEFWMNKNQSEYGGKTLIAAAARALGKNILSAEAFTGDPSVSSWSETPASLKVAGDSAFANGINRMVLHHWVHQPFPDNIKPGMCFGWWGTHFGRNQTWFEPGKEWFTYLARCQTLLQQGEQVIDFCTLELDNQRSEGDAISKNLFLNNLSVVNSKLVLSSGRSYSLLVLPNYNSMLPEIARKLKQLVSDGAVVIGPRPEKSPSIQDWPKADEEVNAIGKELWGKADGISVTENVYGKGRIIWGRPVAVVLSGLGLAADLNLLGANLQNVRWNHRRAGNNDYYFITNLDKKPVHFIASARINGKIPEFWDPETGNTEPAGIWHSKKATTDVDVRLKGYETVFMVFRKPSNGIDAVAKISTSVPDTLFSANRLSQAQVSLRSFAPGRFNIEMASGRKYSVEISDIPEAIEIGGTWTVNFQPGTGTPESHTFNSLTSWTKSENMFIKYFSGTASYQNKFNLTDNYLKDNIRIFLDLGHVKDLADIRINGKPVRVLWHYPFKTDVTGYLKAGSNILEIAVTNTWANRMIGDEQFSEDCTWGKFREGRSIIEFPEWLIKNQPRPSKERSTFATWNYFTKESALLEAGLLGPVRLVFQRVIQNVVSGKAKEK